MIEFVRRLLTDQFEAALWMLTQCVARCPPDHWEARVANDTIRQVAYHTLFFVDYYLSASEDAFALRDLHVRGGDEREPRPSVGLSQEETLAYAALCREKVAEALSRETPESLQGGSGFRWVPLSRGELHVHNIRHVQHHTGALSAALRRIGVGVEWGRSGWR